MKLGQLLGSSDVKVAKEIESIDIENVTLDSRKCRVGTLFVAAKGATPGSRDGVDFIDEAIRAGASAVVVSEVDKVKEPSPAKRGRETLLQQSREGASEESSAPSRFAQGQISLPHELRSRERGEVPLLLTHNPRKTAAQCAEVLAGNPTRALHVFGVTGTNGKTSTTFFLSSILKSAGFKASVLGTLGIGDIDDLHYTGFTTPEAEMLSPALADLRERGFTHVAMEVSSHALALSRCDGLNFAAAAFLNLSEEHLDFHHDMASYRKSKERLFLELLPHGAPCVLPAGDPLVAQMRERGHVVLTFGRNEESDIHVVNPQTSRVGTRVTMGICGEAREVELPVFGDFNLENVMCAVGLAAAKGVSREAIFAALSGIRRPPARLELIGSERVSPLVFIDFAHTPDALEKVLKTIKTFSKGSLRVVFGCGGDRDRQKRPLMGAIAASIADDVWITNDNPRHEDPGQIVEDICAGIEPFSISKCKIIPDRAKAIHEAIKSAHSDDIVLIAGKGHETTQQIGDVYLPFSDRSVAIKALEVWQK